MQAAEFAKFIRDGSRAGKLLSLPDIEGGPAAGHSRQAGVPSSVFRPQSSVLGLANPAHAVSAPAGHSPALLQEVLSGNDDIKALLDDSGVLWYFSEQFISAPYARLLLLKGQGPIKMMTEVIREHSRLYPRPVPLALFQCAPFNLSDPAIALCLKEMTGNPKYRDIEQVTTSIGNVFAYSTDHLDPGFAAMLAEWVDVGQVQNP